MNIVLISDHPMTLGIQFLMTHIKEQRDLRASFRVTGILSSASDSARIECPFTASEREVLLRYIADTKPAVIGLSTIERTRNRFLQLLPLLHKIVPGAFFVAGGIDAISDPHFYLMRGIDGVARGDGEIVLEAILRGIVANDAVAIAALGIPGLVTSLNPDAVPARSPEITPMPYYGEDLMCLTPFGLREFGNEREGDDHVQFVNRRQAIDMYTQRGCTHKCSFCAQDLLPVYRNDSLRNSRRRGLADIVESIASVKERYPRKDFVYFWDLDFLRRPKMDLMDFAAIYRERVGLPFFIFVTEKSVNSAGVEVIRALVEAGLRTINLGIQSGNTRILNVVYQRLNTPEECENAIRLIHEATESNEIEILYDVITYNPEETPEEICDTIRLIMRIPVGGRQTIRLSTHKLSFNTGQSHSHSVRDHTYKDYQDFTDSTTTDCSTQSPYLSWLLGQMMRGTVTLSSVGSLRRDLIDRLLDENFVAAMDKNGKLNQLLYAAFIPRDNEAFVARTISPREERSG
ncbi:MAG TPA: radical SAM protein [Candidatus Dormibacteraeota bacterium]|nr:radical SAM protein [Candidatus Dormibacteraeota bacterium]